MNSPRLDEAAVREIFLSCESSQVTADKFGIERQTVRSIWCRDRHAKWTRHLTRPCRMTIKSHRTGSPKSDFRRSAEEFIEQNAYHMTALEIATALGCSSNHIRRICASMGLRAKSPNPLGYAATEEAVDDYTPAPLPPGEKLIAPAGTWQRVEALASRASRKVELWDSHDDAAPLPLCLAKFEEQEEAMA